MISPGYQYALSEPNVQEASDSDFDLTIQIPPKQTYIPCETETILIKPIKKKSKEGKLFFSKTLVQQSDFYD